MYAAARTPTYHHEDFLLNGFGAVIGIIMLGGLFIVGLVGAIGSIDRAETHRFDTRIGTELTTITGGDVAMDRAVAATRAIAADEELKDDWTATISSDHGMVTEVAFLAEYTDRCIVSVAGAWSTSSGTCGVDQLTSENDRVTLVTTKDATDL